MRHGIVWGVADWPRLQYCQISRALSLIVPITFLFYICNWLLRETARLATSALRGALPCIAPQLSENSQRLNGGALCFSLAFSALVFDLSVAANMVGGAVTAGRPYQRCWALLKRMALRSFFPSFIPSFFFFLFFFFFVPVNRCKLGRVGHISSRTRLTGEARSHLAFFSKSLPRPSLGGSHPPDVLYYVYGPPRDE